MGTRRWHEIKKLSFFWIRHVSVKLFPFLRAKSNFCVKNYAISKKNLSQSDQRFKSNARLSKSCPIGDRVLVREGGVRLGSNYLFLAFLICTDSHSKKMHWKNFRPNFPFMMVWLSRRIYFWEFFATDIPSFRLLVTFGDWFFYKKDK